MNLQFQRLLDADTPDWECIAHQLIERSGQLDSDDVFHAIGKLFELVGELQPLLDMPLTREQMPAGLLESLEELEAEGVDSPSFPMTIRALRRWIAEAKAELAARPTGMRP